jgi:hypothetical protein
MGSQRCGKSSMSHVVFHKMPPHETFFMEGTSSLDVKYVANNALVQFQVSPSVGPSVHPHLYVIIQKRVGFITILAFPSRFLPVVRSDLGFPRRL